MRKKLETAGNEDEVEWRGETGDEVQFVAKFVYNISLTSQISSTN